MRCLDGDNNDDGGGWLASEEELMVIEKQNETPAYGLYPSPCLL